MARFFYFIVLLFHCVTCLISGNLSVTTTPTTPSSNNRLEFDESDLAKLNLKLKWNTDSLQVRSPDRFVLLMEQKRLNLTSFLFDYSAPQLLDDESTIESSTMSPHKFKMRVPLAQVSNIECAMNCINSTKFSTSTQLFECNIYYYEPHSKVCVLYEYDFKDS